jgi:O-antigen ligase/polysaccharide polymerase Wzy-like membrane protein/tetratricopeptide repeat protein
VSQYEASSGPAGGAAPVPRRSVAPAAVRGVPALGRCVPVAIVVLVATAGLAWGTQGSPEARDWLGYALLAGLVVVGALLSGRAIRPSPPAALALAALGGTAILGTISIVYAPLPSLARDEALLAALYVAAFTAPALMLRTRENRRHAAAAIAAGSAGLALCAALALVWRSRPELLFYGGRLNFPITYPNAQAAAMLIGFWPALALAARREGNPWLRSLALAGATATLCGWLLSQSKGGAIGLLVSAAVIFAVSERRLRLCVPLSIAAALSAIGAVPLTAPIRADTTPALRAAADHSGAVLLWLTVAGAAAGLAYAFLDRRIEVSPQHRAVVSRAARLAVALALVGGFAGFFAAVEGPGAFVGHQWRAFKQPPVDESTDTHLLSLGSNRYDFWRVALGEFGDHPLVGTGSRGFGPAYLEHGKSNETPARAHSLPLDALSETGLLGFVLLCLVFAPPIAAVGRRARADLTSAGVLAGCAYFAVHASVDWIWTVPAVGVLAMLLLGVAAASAQATAPRLLARRTSLFAAAAVLGLSLIAFVPPWLAGRYSERAARGAAGAESDIAWAKRLDPLAIEPYVVQAARAPSLEGAVASLKTAVELEPRSFAVHYLYGIKLLELGRVDAARRQLVEAQRLSPRDPYVASALRRADAKIPRSGDAKGGQRRRAA